MKNIAVIPARGGSKRLPDKNIMLLGGLPLLVHSILFAKENPEIIDEIYVSTDDSKIKKVALQYGAKVIDRPVELSDDYQPTATAVKHCLESLDFEVDVVFLLQPTNPLRPENLLTETYKVFHDSQIKSLMTVSRNYHKLGRIADNQFLPFNYRPGQRSQDLEPLFFENGLLYISKAEIIRNGEIISEDVFPFETDHIFANIDIDTRQDFDYAEYIINNYNLKKNE